MHWWTSVSRGSPQKVRRFILNGIDLHERYTRNQLALHIVCDGSTNGHVQVLNMLIDHGADIHGLDDLENTPLHIAAMKGQTKLAEILLKRGAKLHCYNTYLDTPLSLAKWFCQNHRSWHNDTYYLLLKWNGIPRWRAFVKYKKRLREKKYIWLLWIRHKISCDISQLVCWL